MDARTKYIGGIITAWIIFIIILLVISAYLSLSGFIELEKKVTIDNSTRVMRVVKANLARIFALNSDYANWDETYSYVKVKNKNYIDTNFAADFFRSNKIDYVLLLSTTGEVVFQRAFNPDDNTFTDIPPDVVDFFKQNSKSILNFREDYNDMLNKTYGFGGILPITKNDDVVFFVINGVNNTQETETTNAYLIYGKKLSPDFLKNLSAEMAYTIKLMPASQFNKIEHAPKILQSIQSGNDVHIDYKDNHTILGYVLLKDVKAQPAALLEIEFPRVLYAESIHSFLRNSFILLLFSLLGMTAMSFLVYAFFKQQELITYSFERFVPHELIELLNKKSILEVILGTNSKRNMSVLFMDIRNFTSISEELTPQESFDFLNTILREIAPVVINNHGFIDKYIGDAIMALFPDDANADNAVSAAMMILDEMDKINYTGKVNLKEPVKVGIGINTGTSILGIIGAEGRLEGTVISDAVNVASRIQSLTKVYNCPLLISEDTYKSMKHPEFHQITHVEDVQVKGKTIKVSLYKVEKRK